MLCRIDVTQESGTCTVRVAGRLAGPHVDDLQRVCRDAAAPLRVDLRDLLSVDADGIAALRHLAENGAELLSVAEYLRHEFDPEVKTP